MVLGQQGFIGRLRLLIIAWEGSFPLERFSIVFVTVLEHFGAPFLLPAGKCCVKHTLICVKHFQEVLLLLDGLIAGVTLRVKQPA